MSKLQFSVYGSTSMGHSQQYGGGAASSFKLLLRVGAWGPARLVGQVWGGVAAGQRFRRAAGACGSGWPPACCPGTPSSRREAALAAPDPLALPWIAAALAGIEDMLADLSP